MPFKWLCSCGSENYYKGNKEKTANSTCSDCKKTQKIWSRRVVEVKPKVPTKSNQIQPKKLVVPTITTKREDLTLGTDFDRTVLIAGLMDTIKIYKNKIVSPEGKIMGRNSNEGKKVLVWVEMWNDQKVVPMLVVHQAYFQKVDLAYKELKKLRV